MAGGNQSWSGSSQGSEVILLRQLLQCFGSILQSTGRWEPPSETRCEYVLVRLAPPSMAPHSFRRRLPPTFANF
ncbi:hypothetical protein DXI23_03140 [Marinobacter flavimaris]|uniref:Uncharacterized protein n=1 Tax=Marinobacter flavimaris TaxID=262076 RepID=A0A3D8H7H3_9GAMM|nr:hypothetical protein MDHKLMBL_03140 [Marinobacter flavimaris]RDU42682.1 hypothetical protein DXI23_03140 [Marinobacter flavimaris]